MGTTLPPPPNSNIKHPAFPFLEEAETQLCPIRDQAPRPGTPVQPHCPSCLSVHKPGCLQPLSHTKPLPQDPSFRARPADWTAASDSGPRLGRERGEQKSGSFCSRSRAAPASPALTFGAQGLAKSPSGPRPPPLCEGAARAHFSPTRQESLRLHLPGWRTGGLVPGGPQGSAEAHATPCRSPSLALTVRLGAAKSEPTG